MSFKDLIKMPKRQRGIIEHAEPSTSQENINYIGSQLGLTKKGRKKVYDSVIVAYDKSQSKISQSLHGFITVITVRIV